MLTLLLVDDERPARERLRALVGESGLDVRIVAEAASGREALELIAEHHPDVILLDIEMPEIDGFDLIDLLPAPRPAIIFVTAHDEHALRAFEVHALDYLTKPVRPGRLIASLTRVASTLGDRRERIDDFAAARASEPLERIVLHAGRRLKIAPVTSVVRFEATDKVVMAHTVEGAWPCELTLDELERRLDGRRFVRVHRSHLVNVDRARELVPWEGDGWGIVTEAGSVVPVARRRVAAVRHLLGARLR